MNVRLLPIRKVALQVMVLIMNAVPVCCQTILTAEDAIQILIIAHSRGWDKRDVIRIRKQNRFASWNATISLTLIIGNVFRKKIQIVRKKTVAEDAQSVRICITLMAITGAIIT